MEESRFCLGCHKALEQRMFERKRLFLKRRYCDWFCFLKDSQAHKAGPRG